MALMRTYMGADIQYNIKAAAEATLASLKFDGRSRNLTFDNFAGQLKNALNELADLNMDEETKVMKFKNAFQVREFMHLHSQISSTPNLRGSLENTIAFVGEELRSMRYQNGANPSRNLSSYSKPSGKSPHKKWVNPKSKKHLRITK